MSSDWEFLEESEPVTSDAEDSLDAGVEQSQNDVERQRRGSDGADLGDELPTPGTEDS